MVCWVVAAKCGLRIHGMKQELLLQETDRQTNCMSLDYKRSLERIYLQPSVEFIERYKSNWKIMHIFFKNPADGPHPKFFVTNQNDEDTL